MKKMLGTGERNEGEERRNGTGERNYTDVLEITAYLGLSYIGPAMQMYDSFSTWH